MGVSLASGRAGALEFADAIQPVPLERFAADFVGREWLHVPGHRDKFSSLLTWRSLNRILAFSNLIAPQGKLVRGARTVNINDYTREDSLGRQRLSPPKVAQQLREGATLIIDQIDQLHPSIAAFVSSVERYFRVRVQANLYAAWREERGFDTHWDNHDVLVLQVIGRKRWALYGEGQRWPVDGYDAETTPPPTSPPTWEGWLNEGDLLYLPFPPSRHLLARRHRPTMHTHFDDAHAVIENSRSIWH